MGNPVHLVELSVLAWPQYMRSGTPDANGSWMNGNTRLVIDPLKVYRVTAICRRDSVADGDLYVGVAQFDSNGAYIGTLVSVAANGVTPPTTWTTYTATFGPGTGSSFSGSAVTFSPQVVLNFASTTGVHECRELWVEDNAVPGVAISQDRTMRRPSEWRLHIGTQPSFLTLIGADVEPVVLRYATGGYITKPYDSPANAQYDARVRQAGQLREELPPGTGGCITASYGQIVLENSDGALNDWAYFGFDGQPFVVKRGMDDADYSTFTTVMRGTTQQAVVDRKTATVRLLGRDALFDEPVCKARYLGNNSLPAGLEGGADMAGQPKPMLYGVVYGIEPPCVNTARRIYQVSASTTVPAYADQVFVAGQALTAGANYTSQADMETNAPAAGQYRAWPDGGMFRLGSAPGGIVTCDASTSDPLGAGPAHWWAQLYRLALDAGLQTSEIQSPGYSTTHNPPDNWPGADHATELPAVGVWVNDPRTSFRQVMHEIAASVGAWCGFCPAGSAAPKFAAAYFPLNFAQASGAWALTEANLLSVTAVADPNTGRGVPVWRVNLGIRQNHTVFTPSMAPGLPAESVKASFLGLKNQRAVASDAAVKAKNPLAREVVRETCLVDGVVNAGYEAVRQLELLRYTKLWFEVRVSLTAAREANRNPWLNSYVSLSFRGLRVLWQDGVTRDWGYFLVMAREEDVARNQLVLFLRQATEPSL